MPSAVSSLLGTADETSPLNDNPHHDGAAASTKAVLAKLYLSHTLSTWNARTFEFGAVIFLATIFPGTLFYASCYALFRSLAATVLSSWIGGLVDTRNRLWTVRQSIVWQRCSVAASCLVLLVQLRHDINARVRIALFAASVLLACIEKLAFIMNTVAIERDWLIVVSNGLELSREELNSSVRRIDLICKLVAPLCISLIEATSSTKAAIWAVFAQNALSVVFEYYAIAQVYLAVPGLTQTKRIMDPAECTETNRSDLAEEPAGDLVLAVSNYMHRTLEPWRSYFRNPAFLASFSLSLLYLTVLSFSSQMTTYLLGTGFTSLHVSVMRLASVVVELSATCAAPILSQRIGPVRSGLWFVNEQVICLVIALALFATAIPESKLAGASLVAGVILSRIGLWGFDLSVQFLVQEDVPADSRGAFSAAEFALQNLFELLSFAVTMYFYRPEDFKYPIVLSVGATAASAACFAGFVRRRRGHLLHVSQCFGKRERAGYQAVTESGDLEEDDHGGI